MIYCWTSCLKPPLRRPLPTGADQRYAIRLKKPAPIEVGEGLAGRGSVNISSVLQATRAARSPIDNGAVENFIKTILDSLVTTGSMIIPLDNKDMRIGNE